MVKAKAVKKRVKPVKKEAQKKLSRTKTGDTVLKNRIKKLEKMVSLLKTEYKKELSKTKKAMLLEKMQLKKKYDKELSEVKKKLRAVSLNARVITNISNRVSELSKKLSSTPPKVTKIIEEGTPTTLAQRQVMPLSMSEEELAADIVSLYFEEIARHGFKRTLTLDDIIKTFSYTLKEIRKELNFLNPQRQQALEKQEQVETVVEEQGKEVKGFSFTNSRGQKYFLHQRGKLFYFSKKEEGSTPLPKGFTVVENEKTGLPMVKKV